MKSTRMAMTACLSVGCLVAMSLERTFAQEQGPTVRIWDTGKTYTDIPHSALRLLCKTEKEICFDLNVVRDGGD